MTLTPETALKLDPNTIYQVKTFFGRRFFGTPAFLISKTEITGREVGPTATKLEFMRFTKEQGTWRLSRRHWKVTVDLRIIDDLIPVSRRVS